MLLRFARWRLPALVGNAALLAAIALAPVAARADGAAAGESAGAQAASPAGGEREDLQVRFQATWIWQRHLAFDSRPPAGFDPSKYSGGYPVWSLGNGRDTSYTTTFTGYFGFRPWSGGELYLNVEVTQGQPFGDTLSGLGGFYNGEITRASGSFPTLYRQRLFLRQTWNLGGEEERIDGDLNWMAGTVTRDRFVLTAGNFSTLDVFDRNAYSNDPRRQFMNWGHMNNIAFDYAADARGWGWGAIGELYRGDWAFRFGRMTGPVRPNELPIDWQIFKHFGDQLEIERRHEIEGRPGAVRLVAYRNRANLAAYRDAIGYGNSVGWAPDPANGMEYILNVRNGDKTKYGVGINTEQELAPGVGAFFKAMWSDGRTETYAFAEVDRSLSTGLSVRGGFWGRPDDTFGASYLAHYLSRDRREYLQKGGVSYFIGDGWLNYRPESVVELYYSAKVVRGVWLTADYQRVWNPAYNADRGPVDILGVRFHAEW